ncbi:MerR family transcriptional regulator [Actinoplanes awajinensis]|uniref:MerR family transcriptional regulator n=1 Tax=Actinoplanes awajinensis TaxID=135946 RepID=UPI00082EB920|nr:MerR family transcriptional regulator [Actinoplanes awajinensis]
MTELMSIGLFARASRLSVRVLRNYDRLGLLVPVRVDADTGYRWYSVDQFPRAGLIQRLRDLEVPLPEIAEILATDDPRQASAAIERHRERVSARAARLDQIARQLSTVLAEPERVPAWLRVYERWRDPQPVARLVVRTSLSGLAEALGRGYPQLFAALAGQGIRPTGPPGTRYLSSDAIVEPGVSELDVEVFVPVDRVPRPTAGIAPGTLPGCLLAATVHEGGYDEVGVAYRSLGRWLAQHGRVLAGPAEEHYRVPPGLDVPASALRTEVAWPVRQESSGSGPAEDAVRVPVPTGLAGGGAA